MSINEIKMSLEIGLIYGLIAMGIYIAFRIIDFPDLTCDGSFVLGAAVFAALMKAGYSPQLGLGVAGIAGAGAGTLTGLLYTRFKIPNLLCGILVGFMLYSINLYIMGGLPNIPLLEDNTLLGHPLAFLTTVTGMIAIFLIIVLKTDFGLALRSIGQNQTLAEAKGINVPLMTIIGLALSNGLIGLGGALFSQHQGFADVGAGTGTLIVGLASVILGERLIPSFSMSLKIASCVLGSILYRVLISFALHSDLMGLQTYHLNLITGLLVIGIMVFKRRSYAIA